MTTSINTSSKRSKSQRKNHDRCCILRQSNVNLMEFLAADVDIKIRLCAAMCLDYHFHWYGWKIQVHRTPWVYLKLIDIWRDMMRLFSLHVIRAAHELLIRLGLLQRRNNPGNGQDKTYQYKLCVGNLQRAKERMQNRSQPDEKVAKHRKFCSESYTLSVESHTQLQSTAIRSNSLQEECDTNSCDNEEEIAVDLSQDVECDNEATEQVELSQEQESSSESQFSAPPAAPSVAPPQRKPKKLNSRQSKVCSAFLLDEPVFIQWWVNRLLKTKFGAEELVLTPQAFVRSNIRNNPEQALDMWDSFQSEMSQRVDNYNTRREHGCKISPEEHEQIQTIAPYATSAQKPAALPPSQPPEPETVDAQQPAALPSSEPQPSQPENADAYKPYKPSQEVTAPPKGLIQEMMAQLKAKVSMSKAPKVEQKSVEAELDSLNADIKNPLLRSEVLQRVMNSDCYTVDFDEEGVPYQVRKVE